MDRKLDQSGIIMVLNGSPSFLGTIASAGASTTNASTATPFTITKGSCLLLQGDAAFHFKAGDSSSVSAATASTVKLTADEKFILVLEADQTHLAIIPSSGSANVKVFQLK